MGIEKTDQMEAPFYGSQLRLEPQNPGSLDSVTFNGPSIQARGTSTNANSRFYFGNEPNYSKEEPISSQQILTSSIEAIISLNKKEKSHPPPKDHFPGQGVFHENRSPHSKIYLDEISFPKGSHSNVNQQTSFISRRPSQGLNYQSSQGILNFQNGTSSFYGQRRENPVLEMNVAFLGGLEPTLIKMEKILQEIQKRTGQKPKLSSEYYQITSRYQKACENPVENSIQGSNIPNSVLNNYCLEHLEAENGLREKVPSKNDGIISFKSLIFSFLPLTDIFSDRINRSRQARKASEFQIELEAQIKEKSAKIHERLKSNPKTQKKL